MTNILLLEDDNTLGASLTERLQKEQFTVVWARTIHDAKQVLKDNLFDLLILDIRLPDGSGLNLGRDIRMESDVPIIFLTAMNSAELRLNGYEMGADDFIPKPFHLRELILRIKKVLTNRGQGVDDLTISGLRLIRSGFAIEFTNGHKEILAQRDFELLFLLAKASPNVVSREAIINNLWKNEPAPNSRTIDNAIVRLRAHLKAGSEKAPPEKASAEKAAAEQYNTPKTSADTHLRTVRGIGYQWIT